MRIPLDKAWGWDVAPDGAPGDTPSDQLETCTTTCKAGSKGGGAGQLQSPQGIALDSAGNVYAVDKSNNRVQKFSPGGQFLLTWGGGVISGGAEGAGTVESGSTAVTAVSTTKKAFLASQTIAGEGIPPNTTIAKVEAGKIILSQPAGAPCSPTCAATPLTVAAGTGNVPVNERQTVTVDPRSGGGTFTLTFTTPNPSNTTATATAIPYNATALELEEKPMA